MKSFMPPLLVLAALLMAATQARADIEDFYGNWENTAQDATGITHVVISPAGGQRVSVRIYGDCHPMECNWGLVDAKSYTADPSSGSVESVSAVINAGFAHRQVIIRKGPGGRLLFEVLTDFVNGSGKHDFDMSGTLKHSDWAGPVSQNWEHPTALNTGWGGGARSGASPAPQENCTETARAQARVVPSGPSWKVMADKDELADAGADHDAAERAAESFRFYRFDQRCRTGSAPLIYWKSHGTFPRRKMGGAECVAFNPTTVHAARVGRNWKIVDGTQWIADFGADKHPADALLALIRFHHLDAECFVRRANPVMVYWLSD